MKMWLVALLVVSTTLVAGCGAVEPAPTPTLAPTVRPAVTITPASTPSPIPPATAIATVAASPTPAATATVAPSPTQTRPATSAPSPSPAKNVTRGTALVESIQITMLESMPVQVRVLAQVSLPDACTKLDQVRQERSGNTFTVTITTVRPSDVACAAVIVPTEATVPLDVQGLKAGTYTVNVNGVSGSFTLQSDNTLVK